MRLEHDDVDLQGVVCQLHKGSVAHSTEVNKLEHEIEAFTREQVLFAQRQSENCEQELLLLYKEHVLKQDETSGATHPLYEAFKAQFWAVVGMINEQGQHLFFRGREK